MRQQSPSHAVNVTRHARKREHMPHALATSSPPDILLSICITTFNRARFIGFTLESIVGQLTQECEVVVLDGGSTDDTELVVLEYVDRAGCIRYVKQEVNRGLDRDCDRVVELARGKYCWLMPDDDLLKEGAIAALLTSLRQGFCLVIVDAEVRDLTMTKVLQTRTLDLPSDRVYSSKETDELFRAVGDALRYIGRVVIERAVWLARERERYYGSLFIHLGVIFQARLPGDTLLKAQPLISYRMGNGHTFSPKIFETFMVHWPELVWSLNVGSDAKRAVCLAEPWRDLQELLRWRGRGLYSAVEYRRWVRPRLCRRLDRAVLGVVAASPGVLVNAFFVLYFSWSRQLYRGIWRPQLMLQTMKASHFYIGNWRLFNRASG